MLNLVLVASIVDFVLTPRDIQRFWSHVAKQRSYECWPWLGPIMKAGGYGSFEIQRDHHKYRLRAHQVAYRATNSDWAPDKFVIPTCGFPLCCNPKHLVLGTAKDKAVYAKERGSYDTEARRASRPRGEDHKQSKLTWAIVREIRARRETSPVLVEALKRQYNVTVCDAMIRRIRRGVAWKEP